MEHLHRWSQLFYTNGWSTIVSYDDQHRAEQFIFSKTQLPFTHPPPMNASEQKELLEKFKEGSTWSPPASISTGPAWTRNDGQGYAFYMNDQRWMILTSKAGMDRSIEALNLKVVE